MTDFASIDLSTFLLARRSSASSSWQTKLLLLASSCCPSASHCCSFSWPSPGNAVPVALSSDDEPIVPLNCSDGSIVPDSQSSDTVPLEGKTGIPPKSDEIKGTVYEHVSKTEADGTVVFSCIIAKNRGNLCLKVQQGWVKYRQHDEARQSNAQKKLLGNSTIGPMDAFLICRFSLKCALVQMVMFQIIWLERHLKFYNFGDGTIQYRA